MLYDSEKNNSAYQSINQSTHTLERQFLISTADLSWASLLAFCEGLPDNTIYILYCLYKETAGHEKFFALRWKLHIHDHTMINQTLRNRYIQDPNRLVELLKHLFVSDFRIEVITSISRITELWAFSLTRVFRKSLIFTYLLSRENWLRYHFILFSICLVQIPFNRFLTGRNRVHLRKPELLVAPIGVSQNKRIAHVATYP